MPENNQDKPGQNKSQQPIIPSGNENEDWELNESDGPERDNPI